MLNGQKLFYWVHACKLVHCNRGTICTLSVQDHNLNMNPRFSRLTGCVHGLHVVRLDHSGSEPSFTYFYFFLIPICPPPLNSFSHLAHFFLSSIPYLSSPSSSSLFFVPPLLSFPGSSSPPPNRPLWTTLSSGVVWWWPLHSTTSTRPLMPGCNPTPSGSCRWHHPEHSSGSCFC